MQRIIRGVLIIVAGLVLWQGGAAAEEKTEFNPYAGIKENFLVNVGKRVAIRTESGDTIDGIIARVGDHNVQISKLAGKDFSDAIVRIEKIESFTFRVR
ncbi:MAG TPA: hypothetical protein VEP69_01060 [Thermodesulfovibrionales bacterium]|nr:hypothetical protein [Thermodesulfovibrionales bacterium]